MKIKKLIARINEFADSDLSKKKKKSHQLKKTLKILKRKYETLRETHQNETDPIKQEVLANKMKIVQTQRQKGIALRKELKEVSKETSPELAGGPDPIKHSEQS